MDAEESLTHCIVPSVCINLWTQTVVEITSNGTTVYHHLCKSHANELLNHAPEGSSVRTYEEADGLGDERPHEGASDGDDPDVTDEHQVSGKDLLDLGSPGAGWTGDELVGDRGVIPEPR